MVGAIEVREPPLLLIIREARVERHGGAVRLGAKERARGELSIGIHQQTGEVAEHRLAAEPGGELAGDVGGAEVEGPVRTAEALVGRGPGPRFRDALSRVFAGQQDGAVSSHVGESVVDLERHG